MDRNLAHQWVRFLFQWSHQKQEIIQLKDYTMIFGKTYLVCLKYEYVKLTLIHRQIAKIKLRPNVIAFGSLKVHQINMTFVGSEFWKYLVTIFDWVFRIKWISMWMIQFNVIQKVRISWDWNSIRTHITLYIASHFLSVNGKSHNHSRVISRRLWLSWRPILQNFS